MKRVLVIGPTSKPFREYLMEREDIVIDVLVDKDSRYTSKPGVNNIYRTVFGDRKKLYETLDSLKKPDLILSTLEKRVKERSLVGNYWDLPVPELKAAEIASDKYLMRSAFMKNYPEITPNFSQIRNQRELKEFAGKYDYPLVLKPTNLQKSLLISKNDNLKQLLENYEYMRKEISEIYKKNNINREPKIIVEEYIQGSFHSVDGFVGKTTENVTIFDSMDLEMAFEIGIDDTHNYSRIIPSDLDEEQLAEVETMVVKSIKSMGLTNSAVHAEYIYSSDGPKIIEIGARNGGYRPEMYSLCEGIDLYDVQIQLALGNTVELNTSEESKKYVGVFEIFPQKNGILKGIENWDKVRELESFHSLEKKSETGDQVKLAKSGGKMIAQVTLVNSDRDIFYKDKHYLDNNINIILED